MRFCRASLYISLLKYKRKFKMYNLQCDRLWHQHQWFRFRVCVCVCVCACACLGARIHSYYCFKSNGLSKFDKNKDSWWWWRANLQEISSKLLQFKQYLQKYVSSLRVPQITFVKFSHLLVVSENCSGYGHSATFKGNGLTSFFQGYSINDNY